MLLLLVLVIVVLFVVYVVAFTVVFLVLILVAAAVDDAGVHVSLWFVATVCGDVVVAAVIGAAAFDANSILKVLLLSLVAVFVAVFCL